MNVRRIFKTGRWLGIVAVLAAIFGLAAIACSDDNNDNVSVDEAQAAFCGDLETLQSSVAALGGLSASSTVEDLQSARDDVQSALDDVRSSAQDVKDAKIDGLESAYDDMSGAIDDLPGDQTVSEAMTTLQPNIDAVNSAWEDAYNSAACSASPTGETTPSATAGTPAEGAAGELDIKGMEYRFDAPATIAGGLTTIKFDNIGGEDHQVQLVKLNDGVTMDAFTQALNSDPTGGAAFAQGTAAGGVNGQPPGASGEAVQDLSEGTYALICFFSGADDVPHFAKGMLASMTVTAPPADQPAAPTADAEIAAADFTFTGDTTLTAGEHTVHLTNNGPQAHEMTIVKLDEGFTVDMLKAQFAAGEPTAVPGTTPEEQGPPPFSSAGGLGAIMPNTDSYAILNLAAGNYALLCFVPDQATGAPHAALGMVVPLTVQ